MIYFISIGSCILRVLVNNEQEKISKIDYLINIITNRFKTNKGECYYNKEGRGGGLREVWDLGKWKEENGEGRGRKIKRNGKYGNEEKEKEKKEVLLVAKGTDAND